QERSLNDARAQLDSEKQQLQAALESLQNERRQFLDEKLQWKPEESRATAAALPSDDTGRRKSSHKRRKRRPEAEQKSAASAASVNLNEQVLRLQAERHELQAMRAQVAEELQRMRAGRIDPASPASAPQAGGEESPSEDRPRAVRLLLDPGRANGRAVAEVLSEIVELGRLSGVQIARVETTDCRTCH